MASLADNGILPVLTSRAMNHSSKHCSVSLVLTAVLLLIAANGCGKKEETKSSTPLQPTQRAAVVSAEKTSFNEVTAQLDPGGSLYAYLSTSQWLEGLSGRINGWREAVLSLPNLGTEEKSNLTKAFDLVTRLVKNSGIESISGVGLSGIALEKGFYQTKFVVGRDATSAPGGIWTVFGRAPRPLHELDWLPADAVWAGFSDVDLGAIWNTVVNELNQAGFPEAKAGLDHLNGVVQVATGKGLDELLGSLGGQCGAFLALKDAKKINIPLPDGRALEVPEPGLVIVLKVKDDTLFNWIDRALQENPQVIKSDAGDLRMRTMPIPLPVPIELRPTIARQGEHLFIASNDELIKNMMAVKAGKLAGLKTTAEFKRLVQGMPSEGNAFTFVSQRLSDTAQQIQKSVLSSMPGQGNEMPAALMQKIYSINQPISSLVVSRSTPQGWLTVGHGTQEPAGAVVLPLVVVPTAILAGLALPALAQAKNKSQAIVCVNNLKQMGLAVRIYATDHNDKFPSDFLEMKAELATPRVLICPADSNRAVNATLTWENFDPSQSSYEYVTRGLSEATPGIDQKVLFRCKFHGHECMGDGSVKMKGSGAQKK
jgi:hypothetical protein